MDVELPKKIRENAEKIISNLLPTKSDEKYTHVYEQFMEWKQRENIEQENFSETQTVLIAYFGTLSDKYKSSSLWSFFSMLKTTIQNNNNVDINYPKLKTFLKKRGVGFIAKKSKVFEPEEIRKFLCDASDFELLHIKVILIFGVYGATRADELTKVCVEHVTKHGEILLVKIPDTKTNIPRSFTLEKEHCSFVQSYMQLRPQITTTNRFFLKYGGGKCANQPIGRTKFLNAPKIIAQFLKLENHKEYTGHSFRRTSATLLADAGADILTLKKHGGWRSTSVVEGYIEDSVENKRKIGNLIKSRIESTLTSTVTQSTFLPAESATIASASSAMDLDQNVSTDFDSTGECSFVTDDSLAVPCSIATDSGSNVPNSVATDLSAVVPRKITTDFGSNVPNSMATDLGGVVPRSVSTDVGIAPSSMNPLKGENIFQNCNVNIYYK